MSLNKNSLIVFLIAAATRGAHGSQINCPETLTVKEKGAPLEAASVFEGKPAKLTDLMPDLESYEWDITPNQKYVSERGDSMYLVCRYKGVKKTVDLRIPVDATFCKVEQTANGTAAWCKTPQNSASNNNAKDGHGHQP